MIWQRTRPNELDDIRWQRVQLDHPTHARVIDTFAHGDPFQKLRLVRFQARSELA